MRFLTVLTLIACALYFVCAESPAHWQDVARKELERALNVQHNTGKAKNVIFLLGDGMGISTLLAGRVYRNQLKEQSSTSQEPLTFEKFPHVGLIKTYNDDYLTPDSAATATAYFCGEKAEMGVIGMNSNVEFGQCAGSKGNEISSVLKWAQDAGKATGIVTTTRITHATPAALYAHAADRDWESDRDVESEHRTCKDIASQLIDQAPGVNLKVAFGGGRQKFLPREVQGGERRDKRNLVQEWLAKNNASRASYISTVSELKNIKAATTGPVLGLFADSHMDFELDRQKKPSSQPSLTEMALKALEIVKQSPEGYFLVVEGGRIDHGHHNGRAKPALRDLVEFDNAISELTKQVNFEDTLVVVTADHSHGFTVVGYQQRSDPILGFAEDPADDDLPYTSLSYSNGPAYVEGHVRPDLTNTNTAKDNYLAHGGAPLSSETHAAEDVAIYAKGPWAHLFHSLHEQNYIPIAIDYAACYHNQDPDHCKGNKRNKRFFNRS